MLLRWAITLGLLLPAYQDWKTRWVDDRSWLALIPAYIIIIYGYLYNMVNLLSLFQGLFLGVLIILVMLVYRRMGHTFGGADFILLALVSPLSTAYDIYIFNIRLFYPGLLPYLLLTSILSIAYVLSICIWKNRKRFSKVDGFKEFLGLLYSFETEDETSDKYVVLSVDEGRVRVTPGVPMVTFGFIASVILLILGYILGTM
jgi:hypothetical protein